MKTRSQKATPKERERYRRLKEIPCIACSILGVEDMCGKHEIQHMTSGGRRIGNEFSYPLGAYHHQGHILPGWTGEEMFKVYGPSFGKSKKAFEETFGDEETLLAETNRLLGEA